MISKRRFILAFTGISILIFTTCARSALPANAKSAISPAFFSEPSNEIFLEDSLIPQFETLQFQPSEETPIITLSDMEVYPNQLTPGSVVTISITVTNNSDQPCDHDVYLKIDSKTVSVQTVSNLAGHSSQKVAFTITQDTPGNFDVSVGEMKSHFTVVNDIISRAKPVNWWLIAILIALCLILIWVIFRHLIRPHKTS